ncbi:DNA replication/repair protein RecF [Treponema sp.]|uniref:DNA replication/repair protein RecF n=1 Tax=Treponema sp. TaxID=166 RepID=UPI00388FA58D
MPFISLTPYNFRNLSNETIDLSSREVFFIGENGQGKSNFLESLYYCAYGSSFRTHQENEIIKNNESEMSLYSMFREESGSTHTTLLKIKDKKKSIEKDGKNIHDRKELVNTIPCVLYSHDDLDFAVGAPERRRFFIDQSLSMYDVMYIDVMRRFRKILKSRNLCLAERNLSLIESYDIQLIQNGIEIQKKRKSAVFKFNQIFDRIYEELTGIDGVHVRYFPSWKEYGEGLDCDYIMKEYLFKNREMEIMRGTTLSGPHRDRIVFERNGSAFIPKASTGQRRLVSLILRTAQAVFYSQITGKKPVLLMDDVLLELDPEKRKKVTALLPEYDQLFCTFLPGEPYDRYKRENTLVYEIKEGKWNRSI